MITLITRNGFLCERKIVKNINGIYIFDDFNATIVHQNVEDFLNKIFCCTNNELQLTFKIFALGDMKYYHFILGCDTYIYDFKYNMFLVRKFKDIMEIDKRYDFFHKLSLFFRNDLLIRFGL